MVGEASYLSELMTGRGNLEEVARGPPLSQDSDLKSQMGLMQWSKSHRKEYGWVPPFPVVSLICSFCPSLCLASGLSS